MPLRSRNIEAGRCCPFYAARIEDLGVGDFVKVDCAGCHHIAILTPEVLLRAGLTPTTKVLDLKTRLRCRGCGRRRAVVSVKWRDRASRSGERLRAAEEGAAPGWGDHLDAVLRLRTGSG